MARVRQLIVLIHGVRLGAQSDAWYGTVQSVLEPHFDCRGIKYDDYVGLKGLIGTIFSPWLLVLAILGLSFAGISFYNGSIRWALLGIALALGLTFAALEVAYRRRQTVSGRVKVKLDRELHGYPGQPHVIAHSFGTYVAGTALRKFPNIELRRVVLVGSILSAKYDWNRILAEKARAFEEVRNEQGKRDWLVSLAGILGWHRRDLGDSGVSGFKGEHNFVHHGTGPLEACEQCQAGLGFARIHNIPLKEFGHSDQFLGIGHAFKLWLPFLWGFTPREYGEFLELCHSAAYCRQEQFWDDVDLLESELRYRIWSWTGSSLEDYLERGIRQTVRRRTTDAGLRQIETRIPAIVGEAIALLYLTIVDALLENSSKGKKDLNVIRALYPRIAASRAIEKALRSAQ